MADNLSDPAWDAYHATAVLPGGEALLEPGATVVPAAAALPLTAFDAAGGASVLPGYVAPQGKAVKPIEEAGAAGESAWAAAGACILDVSLRVARPLVEPWRPPPPPPRPLLEAVPPRPELKPYEEPHAAADAFVGDVRAMARAVAALQLQGQAPLARGLNDPAAVAELARALAAAGKLQELKAGLKKHAVRVALEKLRAGMDGSPLDAGAKAAALRDLHAYLAGLLSSAIDDLRGHRSDQAGAAQGSTTGAMAEASSAADGAARAAAEIAKLSEVAGENEEQGLWARAEALHQRCVLLARGADADAAAASNGAARELLAPGAWRAYGAFCLRRGPAHQGRAEECLRAALAADPGHIPSLTALALLLLHQGQATDGLHLREALSLARQLAAHATPPPSVTPSLTSVHEESSGMRGSMAGVGEAGTPRVGRANGGGAVAGSGGAAAGRSGASGAGPADVGGGECEAATEPGTPLAWGVLLLVTQALGDEARSADVGAALQALACAESAGLVVERVSGLQGQQEVVGAEGSSHSVAPSGSQVQGSAGLVSAQPSAVSIASDRTHGGGAETVSLRPGVHPFMVNGLVAVAAAAAELALPAVALAAVRAAAAELPTSAGLPAVAAELELAGAAANLWILKWEVGAAGGSLSGPEPEAQGVNPPAPENTPGAAGEGAAVDGVQVKEVGEEGANVAGMDGGDGGATAQEVSPAAGARARAAEALANALALCDSAQSRMDGAHDAAAALARVHALRGDVAHAAGRWGDAVRAYVGAVQAGAAAGGEATSPPLRVFLNLAASYHALGKPGYALDVYVQVSVGGGVSESEGCIPDWEGRGCGFGVLWAGLGLAGPALYSPLSLIRPTVPHPP